MIDESAGRKGWLASCRGKADDCVLREWKGGWTWVMLVLCALVVNYYCERKKHGLFTHTQTWSCVPTAHHACVQREGEEKKP